ncbi:hypothetical protein BKA66DRAFT_433485 [Pyrenochaeta sp. MPI-SDFR-AT-0127]|nr:hypothetical protein BKA66DRAFT_433485 [Pyrenochaeta sp. MPI-SDFR-AT-0127]
MLADGKINSMDTHLEEFKLKDHTRQNDLQNLLKEYGQLLDDYKVLKRVFEEKSTKNGTAYKTGFSIDKARNAYVLVLIDGNGYIFNDELIRDKEEGGMRAARMLSDAVDKYLQQSVPEAASSRVIVRIYADLTNLSKQLAKSKVAGLEKRSIAPFSAAFTRAISLFDFVDALDEEGTRFKLREQFKIASEDVACSHILFAACHDSSYLSQLVPFSGSQDKITLVQGAGWNPDFHQFNLNVTQFPTIFRWSGLPMAAPTTKILTPNGPAGPKPKAAPQKQATPSVAQAVRENPWRLGTTNGTASTSLTNEMAPIETNGFGDKDSVGSGKKPTAPLKGAQPCKHFMKGFCPFGNKCRFQHSPTILNGASQDNPASLKPSSPSSSSIPTERSNISSHLPLNTVAGFLPLNKNAQRIDTYIRAPTSEEWRIYNARFHRKKPCNSYHLQRVCTTFDCPYDHTELEPETRHVLEYVLKCNPCPRKSDCRESDCFYGHVCQKDGCTGQMKGCRMKADLHNVDPKVSSMVPSEDEMVHDGGVEMPDEHNFLW